MTSRDAAPLPRSTPEEQGVPSAALLAMTTRWQREGNEPHGVVVLRHGLVVAEGAWAPWPRDGIRLVYSVSKTFLAIAAAFAEAEGLLRRDERICDVFPEAADVAGPRAGRITVEDCLRMSTGHHVDTMDGHDEEFVDHGEESVRAFLAAEPDEEPGSWFTYHNGASRVLALAVQRRTGQRLLDYLRPRLLDPIGIEEAAWIRWGGADLGFSGLHISTESIARLGQLLLRDGAWDGVQVLPSGWVATASRALADTTHHPDPADWKAGYGYQMWRSRHGFRADGAFGQFALVLPEHDLVVAVTSCTETTHEVLDAVWEELLPHLADGPLPADPRALDALTEGLATLSAPARGSTAPAPGGPGPWSFEATPTDEHPFLRSVEVSRARDGWTLTVDDVERLVITCGDGSWPDAGGSPYVASGGWVGPGAFEATVVAHETPHSLLLRCADGAVSATWRALPLHWPSLARLRAPRD